MLSPGEFVNFYAQAGAKKCANRAEKLYLSAVLAGFYIASGAVVANTAGHLIANAGLSRVVCGLLFPFGLIMVIITGAELFTGNCMITISLLEKKAALAGMVRNLVIVYVGNLLGALILASIWLPRATSQIAALVWIFGDCREGHLALFLPLRKFKGNFP